MSGNCYRSSGGPGLRDRGEGVSDKPEVAANMGTGKDLYESAGYEITSIYMTKQLTR